MARPKKISVRPGNTLDTLEGGGLIVWVYHRKAQVQIAFDTFPSVEACIQEAVAAWYFAMDQL